MLKEIFMEEFMFSMECLAGFLGMVIPVFLFLFGLFIVAVIIVGIMDFFKEKAMTDNEIIKALKCCTESNSCNGCPFYVDYGFKCKGVDAQLINLIKRQQAEIDNLEEKLSVEIADGGASCHLCLKKHRAEAIKAFVMKLKIYVLNPNKDFYLMLDEIDNLVKEMAGADDDI